MVRLSVDSYQGHPTTVLKTLLGYPEYRLEAF